MRSLRSSRARRIRRTAVLALMLGTSYGHGRPAAVGGLIASSG